MSAICLIDCNNFYPSCERVFDAKIQHSPVAVLSNNDGCVIARSEETKALGISMGMPFFKAKRIIESNNIEIFSSNFPLYADLSSRIWNTVGDFSPACEIYSIDEAFLEFPARKSQTEFTDIGWKIKEKVKKWVGIPVSVGFAETKTLAKVANRIAKKSKKAGGVLDLYKSKYQRDALERTKVEDVWGIGPAYADDLNALRIKNALQLRDMDLRQARDLMTVMGARTVLELRGRKCFPLDINPGAKKSISCSRTFGESVVELKHLKEAVAYFLSRAVEKLRNEGLSAKAITVSASSDPFRRESYYSNSATNTLIYPTDLLVELQSRALQLIERIYRQNVMYKKAGVLLSGLVPSRATSLRMLDDKDRVAKWRALMRAIDEINRKYGRDTVRFAVNNPSGIWQMKQMRRSNRYTTRLNEIMVID